MRTVFVIGAGANVEIGMPGGNELKKEIAERLNFEFIRRGDVDKDRTIFDALVKISRNDIDQVFGLASTVKEAMPFAISIDNFIDAHRNEPLIALCGKLAIVKSILTAEKESDVYRYFKTGNQNFAKTWYPLFFQKITEGCEINEFIERLKDISFIIFNYDRCFEYYMIHAIDAYYKIGAVKAKGIVNAMNIIHPYGTIGDMDRIPLDASLYYDELIGCSQNIRTFAEYSRETKEEQTSIKHLIDRANRVIFLGFAYHQINLDLIFNYKGYAVTLVDPAPPSDRVDCYGTGFKISENDRKYIQFLLKRMDSRIETCDISGDSCTDFFFNFWHRLSFRD